MLASVESEQRGGDVPVIGQGDRDGVNRPVVENTAKVGERLRLIANPRVLSGEPFGIDVADGRDLDVRQREERLGMPPSLIAGAKDRNADAIVRPGRWGATAL
jgi:hypothetical protein